ncbi:MAG: outer membrane protein assembly factor BamA [Pseudomonadota bacterium]
MPTLRTIRARGIRLALLLLLVAAPAAGLNSFAFTSGAAAQSSAIRDIRVSGNRRVEAETVRSYLQFSVGDRYDPFQVDQSLQSLYATGLFRDVRIERRGATVVVVVIENPVINKVVFEGNDEVEDKSLATEVQLKSRSIYTRARVQADVQRILDLYRRQGQYAATVEPKIIQLEHNRVNLVFEITEGNATKVKSINFIGNRAFSDSQLRDIITTTQKSWLDFLKSGAAIYDPDRLNLDRELLRQYYLKNGYADARIVSAVADLDRDGSGFFITFTIDEGERYRFGNVDVLSKIGEVNADDYRGDLLIGSGDVFNASLIDKSVEKLTLAVSGRGYAFARVRPRAERDPISRTISIVFEIGEGPRVYIERINIYGNVRTRDYVIRREFRLVEGDAYNPLMVDRAKKRLQALGFFKKVKVKRRAGSARDRVVLDVHLAEQSTGELSFGGGYSTNEGIIGDISITERNLMGRGQFLRLKLSGSIQRAQIDLSFTEPRFLDRNLAAGFDLFHKDVDQSSSGSYRFRKTGGGLRLGFPIAENLWMNTRYTLSRDEIYDVGNEASFAIKQAAADNDGVAFTSALGFTVVYDKRNHPKNPNRGYYFNIASDFAGAGGDVQYWRTQAEARAYYPVAKGVTLVGRIIGGHIAGWGGEDVRLIDLFYKGGETIRGFSKSGFGPRDVLTGDAIGGTTWYAMTAELRFPIPFLPKELGMGAAIFADAGSLFNAGGNAEALNTQCVNRDRTLGICLADNDTIRASAGFGILWNSPVGPLRADFAWALQKATEDEEQFFRFGASTKF